MSDEFTVRHVSGNCGNTMPHPYSHPHPHPTSVPAHEHDVKPCPITIKGEGATECDTGEGVLDCGKTLELVSTDGSAKVVVTTDADGNVTADFSVISSPTDGDGLVDNGNSTWTYTNDDGSTALIVDTDTWTTVNDNGDGSFTATNADGSIVTWTLTVDTYTEAVDNGDGSFTFTMPDGTVVEIPAPAEDCCPELVDNGDGTYTWTDGFGVNSFTFSTVPSSMVDNGDGTYTHDNGSGDVVTIIDTDTFTTVTSNADGSTTLVQPDGTVVTIPADTNTETVTQLIVNPDGSFTYINESGTPVVVPAPAAYGWSYTDGTGATNPVTNGQTVDFCKAIQGCTAFTVQNSNGDSFDIPVGGTMTIQSSDQTVVVNTSATGIVDLSSPSAPSNYHNDESGSSYDPNSLPAAPSTLPSNPDEGHTLAEHYDNGVVYWTYTNGAWVMDFEQVDCPCIANAQREDCIADTDMVITEVGGVVSKTPYSQFKMKVSENVITPSVCNFTYLDGTQDGSGTSVPNVGAAPIVDMGAHTVITEDFECDTCVSGVFSFDFNYSGFMQDNYNPWATFPLGNDDSEEAVIGLEFFLYVDGVQVKQIGQSTQIPDAYLTFPFSHCVTAGTHTFDIRVRVGRVAGTVPDSWLGYRFATCQSDTVITWQ